MEEACWNIYEYMAIWNNWNKRLHTWEKTYTFGTFLKEETSWNSYEYTAIWNNQNKILHTVEKPYICGILG